MIKGVLGVPGEGKAMFAVGVRAAITRERAKAILNYYDELAAIDLASDALYQCGTTPVELVKAGQVLVSLTADTVSALLQSQRVAVLGCIDSLSAPIVTEPPPAAPSEPTKKTRKPRSDKGARRTDAPQELLPGVNGEAAQPGEATGPQAVAPSPAAGNSIPNQP